MRDAGFHHRVLLKTVRDPACTPRERRQRQPLFTVRIVDHGPLVVHVHGRTLVRVVRRPSRDAGVARIPGSREREPRAADSVGERLKLRTGAHHFRQLPVVLHRERNLDAVRRQAAAAFDRRSPSNLVQERGRPALRGLAFGLRVRVARKRRDREIDLARRRLRPVLPEQVVDPIAVVAEPLLESRPHGGLVQRQELRRREVRAFGFSGSDDHRDVGRHVGRVRIERIARQRVAVHDRAEPNAVRAARSRAAAHGREQLRDRHVLQFRNLRGLETELRGDPLGRLLCLLPWNLLQRRPAFDDRFVEETFRGRHRQQRAHFATAAGLTEDRHVPGIASEGRDVVAHPLQRRHDVEHADVCRIHELGACTAKVQVPDDVQAMVDADDHDVARAGEIRAVVAERRAGSIRITAAVDPHHHRTLAAVVDAGREHVQDQAVLALRRTASQAPADRARSRRDLW